jgi:predicted Zn-dependent protease
MAVVRCGTYPVQTIEVGDKEFAEKLEAVFMQRERSWLSRMMNKNVFGIARVIIVFLAVLFAAYFWLIPFLAERLAKRVPVSYEEKLGDGLYDVLKTNFIIDEKKTAYINDFFRELKIPTAYNIRITVVKDEIANAFALPGGNIVVYDQIINDMNNYEDLAALLAHEFTHVNEKHTTRSLFRQLGASVFLSVIIGDVGGISNLLISNADNLKGLNYSRSLEKEADINGIKLLSERKIDCNGFVHLFELLKKESTQQGPQPAEWISSHPDLERRSDYVKKNELFNKNGVEQNEILRTLFLKIKMAD